MLSLIPSNEVSSRYAHFLWVVLIVVKIFSFNASKNGTMSWDIHGE